MPSGGILSNKQIFSNGAWGWDRTTDLSVMSATL